MGNCCDKEILTDEISTKHGKIVGRKIIHSGNRPVNAFQGIPYAKAPLKDLRFKKSIPPDPWDGVFHATKFGPRCCQKIQPAIFAPLDRFKYGSLSEDCLRLNVFAPAWVTQGQQFFPVLVFIHGGGYVSDSSVKYGDIGIARHLVAEQELVVVTIQYRLGYFGFFSTGESDCPGNIGLWDMTLALTWIQENIGLFGGDKSNVTIMGQSAGGSSVDLLSLSPHSRDLFKQVIPMAGNADCDFAVSNNVVECCRYFGFTQGIITVDSHEFVERVRQLPAAKLALGIGGGDGSASESSVKLSIGPRIDGDFLPKPVGDLRTEAPKKHRMIGICEYEGLIMQFLNPSAFNLNGMLASIAGRIPENKFPNFKQLRAQALSMYIEPKNLTDKNAVYKAASNLFTDIFLALGTHRSVLEHLRVGNEHVYLYRFDYYNPKSLDILGVTVPFKGATHCTELAYLFHVGIIKNFKFNAEDEKMLQLMTKMWANFAKYGDPNGSEEVPESQLPFKWLPVSAEHPTRFLSIKLEPEMKEHFYEDRNKFWIDLLN